MGLALALALCLSLPAFARERVTLQKGVSTGTLDQTNAQNSWVDQGNTGTNHGGATTLVVARGGTAANRPLVQFDTGFLPRSGIKAATLSLVMTANSGSSQTINAYRVIADWHENEVTWTNRITTPQTTAWAAGGGDFNGTALSGVTSGTTNGVTLSWDVSTGVQTWMGNPQGGSTGPNLGFLIHAAAEGNPGNSWTFAANANATTANRPSLQITFVQQATGFTVSSVGNLTDTMTWTNPTVVSGSTVLEAYSGVIIVRRSASPISDTFVPTDGTTYAACNTITSGGQTNVVVFSGAGTTFTDANSCTGSNAMANGTQSFYKIFVFDTAHNYSSNGTDSSFVPMAMAVPNSSGAYKAQWIAAQGQAVALAAPGIDPGVLAVLTSNSNQIQFVDPATGQEFAPPFATSGAISTSARPPVLEALDTAPGLNANVTFVTDQDDFVYAVDTSTGSLIWFVNPTALGTNAYTEGSGVLLQQFATTFGSSYTGIDDLVIVGTNNGGSTTTNRVTAVNGSTGSTTPFWNVIGATSQAPATGCAVAQAACNMDIVTSTPLVDYVNSAIWVTTNNAATAAAAPSTRPDVWKLRMDAGNDASAPLKILAVANVGGNISSSPTIGRTADTLFVVRDTVGTIVAMNPASAAATIPTLASFTPAANAGTATGFPLLMTQGTPYLVYYVNANFLHKVTFTRATSTFSAGLNVTAAAGTGFSAACTTLSTPIGFAGLRDSGNAFDVFYVGCNDGRVYEVNSGTLNANKFRQVVASGTAVGDPTLDVVSGVVLVGAGARTFAFSIPF